MAVAVPSCPKHVVERRTSLDVPTTHEAMGQESASHSAFARLSKVPPPKKLLLTMKAAWPENSATPVLGVKRTAPLAGGKNFEPEGSTITRWPEVS